MTDEKKPADPKVADDGKTTFAPKITRRRFTKAGAIAPVIMTLGSRPVWGQTACSLSGAMSGNLSNHQHDESGTYGCPPNFWYKNPASWVPSLPPSSTVSGATCTPDTATCLIYDIDSFQTVSALFGGCYGSDVSIYRALASDSSEEGQAVAAYLNAYILGDFAYGASVPEVVAFMCGPANSKVDVLSCMNNRQGLCIADTPCTNNIKPRIDKTEIPSPQIVASGNTGSACIFIVDAPTPA